jgi:hypothetical protein
MEIFLDTSADNQPDMSNDFFNSKGAILLFKITKWARIFGYLTLTVLLLGLGFSVYSFKSTVMMENGAIHQFHLAAAVLDLMLKILQFLPIMYLFKFTNKYAAAMETENVGLAYESFRALKFYFISGLVIIFVSFVTNISSAYVFPYLLDLQSVK